MDRAAEVRAKLERVRGWLDAEDLDAVLVGSQAGFAWLTAGGDAHVSLGEEAGVASVLVTRDEAFVLTANIEARRLREEEVGDLPFVLLERPWHDPDADARLVAEACDPSRAVSELGTAGLPRAGAGFARLRYTLLTPEIERYRRLGLDAAEAVESVCRTAAPGETELEVAARLAGEAQRRNIQPLVNLVASDHRIAGYRHPIPTSNRIGRSLLVALTGRRHGLHASLTRMVSFGEPDADLAARHEAVLRVDARYLLESRPGVSLGEVFARGLEEYASVGFAEEWRLHHQGGLTGYGGREIFATAAADHVLAPDQALAWNPSITRVKSEDTMLVAADGPEVLTTTGAWPSITVEVSAGKAERPTLLVA